MPDTPEKQPPAVSLAAIERALSKQRLDAYATSSDRDEADHVARYMWNVALASALQPSLHVFEVTLRNAIYNASSKRVDTRGLRMPDVQCWLDAEPTLLYSREKEDVDRAKAYLGSARAQRTPGHLIAKLSLGFWVQLTARVYNDLRANGPRLWPGGLPEVFPLRWPPGSKKDVPGHHDREFIYGRLHEVRELRNWAAHHEPLWDRNIEERHGRMLQLLGWMNRKVAAGLTVLDPFPGVLKSGPTAYRGRAERLLGR
jgi:hypothetical protein